MTKPPSPQPLIFFLDLDRILNGQAFVWIPNQSYLERTGICVDLRASEYSKNFPRVFSENSEAWESTQMPVRSRYDPGLGKK